MADDTEPTSTDPSVADEAPAEYDESSNEAGPDQAGSEDASTKDASTKDASTGSGSGTKASSGPAKAAVVKKKVVSKRVTPKGGGQSGTTASKAHAPDGHDAPSSTRYTPPTAKYAQAPSPAWVPVLMFTLLGLGCLVIVLNYARVFGEPDNWRLVIGLAAILGGIITATNYR